MIQVFRRGGAHFDPEDLVLGVPVPGVDGEPDQVAMFPWSDLDRVVLLDGGYEINETTWQGMPLLVIVWTDTSGLRVEMPIPREAAAEMGRALAGMKVQIAKELPKRAWTPT